MNRRAWVRLDNASNIFLAARSDADPKVFRLGAEMDRDVDPVLLQQALDTTYDRYPLYHAVLRSGVFWYYLQDSDLRPLVTAEDRHTCAPIYQADRRALLFRVVHHRRRITLEVFHALSDGTGALWFLSDLVSAYTRLRYPDKPHTAEDEPVHGLTADSFGHYFQRRRKGAAEPHAASRPATGSGSRAAAAFSEAASPAALTVEKETGPASRTLWTVRGGVRRSDRRVHRVRGTRTPDNRTRAVELTMPVREVLGLARAEGVSITMYLTAMFFESIRISSGGLGRRRTLAASVPVNLRQFFPSTSARNFFATVRVEHTYGDGPDDFGSICRQLEARFRPKASPEELERKLRRFIRFERMPLLRVVPRVLKDVILGLINRGNNRGLTVAVSNLGRVVLPGPVDAHVGRMQFHVSAVRPQFCAVSHAGLLTLTFTSPFVETDHVREFARQLTGAGVPVTVAATRVTEAELSAGEVAADDFPGDLPGGGTARGDSAGDGLAGGAS